MMLNNAFYVWLLPRTASCVIYARKGGKVNSLSLLVCVLQEWWNAATLADYWKLWNIPVQ